MVDPADQMCIELWPRVKRHMDFIGDTYNISQTLRTLARMTQIAPKSEAPHMNTIDHKTRHSTIKNAGGKVALKKGELTEDQLRRINRTQQGDWAMFSEVPYEAGNGEFLMHPKGVWGRQSSLPNRPSMDVEGVFQKSYRQAPRVRRPIFINASRWFFFFCGRLSRMRGACTVE